MSNKRHLSTSDCRVLCGELICYIRDLVGITIRSRLPLRIYGVPRGGTAAAYLLASIAPTMFELVDEPGQADLLIDDIIDSGRTMKRYSENYPSKSFFALINKKRIPQPFAGEWIVFPWEDNGANDSINDNIIRLLQFIGEDVEREGLQETPERVAKAWQHWGSGYSKNPADILKVFEDGAEGYNEMILVKDAPFYTHCEHHMAPFFGQVTVAYIPDRKIVGLSKIPRLIDVFARRLQVQERLTTQIADAIQEHLSPKGVGVIVKARHLCMESRGICQQGHHTVTSALRGVMQNDAPRAEFLNLAR